MLGFGVDENPPWFSPCGPPVAVQFRSRRNCQVQTPIATTPLSKPVYCFSFIIITHRPQPVLNAGAGVDENPPLHQRYEVSSRVLASGIGFGIFSQTNYPYL